MTHYYNNWLSAMSGRDHAMITLFVMSLLIVAAWVVYTDWVEPKIYPILSDRFPRVSGFASHWGRLVFLVGGFMLYWLTFLLYALEV